MDVERPETGSQPVLGSMCLFLGTALLWLSLISDAAGLPFRMPVFWYHNRPLWYLVALGLFVAGCALLRQRGRPSGEKWQPSRPGVRFGRVVLYTKEGCHLCDHAKDDLLRYREYLPEIEEVDILTDPALVERFGTCIPVVEIDGRIRFRGRVNEVLLRRLIEATPPRA